MNGEKKKYLSQYLLQHSKIMRLKSMPFENETEKTEISRKIILANNLRLEIENKIESVDGGVLSELLYLKYVCGKSLLEISDILNYSPRHTERLHKKALENFKL